MAETAARDAQPFRLTANHAIAFLVSVVVWLVSTPLRSAFFLQIDTGAQDYVALALTQGCFEFFTEKMLGVFLLAPVFAVSGASVYTETVLLALSFGLTALLAYELTVRYSGSTLAGFSTVALLFAFPALVFFSHTYIGYIFPFALLAWLLVDRRRWFWAGVAFGLTLVGHFNMLVPLGFTALVLVVTHLRHERWHRWLVFAIGGLLPLAFTEGVFFFYLGHVFAGEWTRGILGILNVLAGPAQAGGAATQSDWGFLSRALVGSNGLLRTLLLVLAPLSLALRGKDRTLAAMTTVWLLVPLFYALQAGFGWGLVVSRSMVAGYVFWAIAAAVGLHGLAKSVLDDNARWLQLGFAALVLALALSTSIFMHSFMHTVLPEIVAAIEQAAEENRPVRYAGNWRIAMFVAQRDGVEILINDVGWREAGAPGNAVLIFADGQPVEVSADGYDVRTYEVDSAPDARYPLLTDEAGIVREVEVWWPQGPSEPVDPGGPTDVANSSYYYAGTGCYTAPRYINREMHFYELAWYKLGEWLGLRPPLVPD